MLSATPEADGKWLFINFGNPYIIYKRVSVWGVQPTLSQITLRNFKFYKFIGDGNFRCEKCVGDEIYYIPEAILRPTLLFFRNTQFYDILLFQRQRFS